MTSRVLRHDIELTHSNIYEILRVPSEGYAVSSIGRFTLPRDFDIDVCIRRTTTLDGLQACRRIIASDLHLLARVIHLFITYTICPYIGHRYEVSILELFVVDNIIEG